MVKALKMYVLSCLQSPKVTDRRWLLSHALQPTPIKELISALLVAADTNDDAFTAALQGFAAWEFGKVRPQTRVYSIAPFYRASERAVVAVHAAQ